MNTNSQFNPSMLDAQLDMHAYSGTYYSEALGREQPYAVLAPLRPSVDGNTDETLSGNGEPTSPRCYPLLVLLHGLTGSYADWLTHTRLARYAAAYDLFIACPEGGSGWYTDAFDGNGRYEDDLVKGFLPHLQSTLPLAPPGRNWAIGGLSMGGYGAIKIALRYPKLFSLAVSHSGALEETRSRSLHPVFGDPENNASLRRNANVFSLAEDALSRWPTERPRLYIDCGLEDSLLPANQRFHQHLNFIGYQHAYLEMPGYHTWPYWDRAMRTALPTIAAAIGAEKYRVAGG